QYGFLLSLILSSSIVKQRHRERVRGSSKVSWISSAVFCAKLRNINPANLECVHVRKAQRLDRERAQVGGRPFWRVQAKSRVRVQVGPRRRYSSRARSQFRHRRREIRVSYSKRDVSV